MGKKGDPKDTSEALQHVHNTYKKIIAEKQKDLDQHKMEKLSK